MRPKEFDEELAALARRQHGVVARRQVDAGPHRMRIRVRGGRWQPVARDVFVLTGSPPTWRQRLMAAVLEAGPDAAASHRSAAALLTVPGFEEGRIEVTRRRAHDHAVTLSRLHETSWLPPAHVTRVDGIPCTALARTLFDLGATEHPERVARAVKNARRRRGLTVAAYAEVVATLARRGRPGTALARRLLAEHSRDHTPTESELEDLFVAVLGAHGVPQLRRQVDIGDATQWLGRVDFLALGARLIIEVDGEAFHDPEDDAKRDARMAAAGFRTRRFTWSHLTQRPAWVASEVRRELECAVETGESSTRSTAHSQSAA